MANRQKVVIVGDARVGKSALLKRMLGQGFKENYIPTLGCDTLQLTKRGVNYDVWDTAGDPRFQGLGSSYWNGANIGIVVIDHRTPLRRINPYIRGLQRACGNIRIFLVVNKCDIGGNEERDEYLKQKRNVVFVSCKNNVGIRQLLNKL